MMAKIFNRSNIIFILIIMLLSVSFFIASSQKAEYSIDEIYSLVISNSYGANSFSDSDSVWGKWVSSEEFEKFITVQDDEHFSYVSVYRNTSTDCHPPLYYWFLNTACSLFSSISPFKIGLVLNVFFFIGTCIFIYLISKKLIHSTTLSYLPIIAYGFSAFAVETYTFIRMYMLLTLLAMIFLYAHICIFQDGFKTKYLLLVWISIFLGAMTQYYFLVMSFWGVLLSGIYFLKKKHSIKSIVIYGLGCLVSVLLMLIIFPYAVSQATGISTNNVGNEVVKNLFNFKLWLDMCWELFYSTVANLSYSAMKVSLIIILVVLCIIIYLLISCISKKITFNVSFELVWISILFVLAFLSVAFIGGEYVYLRYIYFIIPILYLTVFSFMDTFHPSKHTKILIASVCICFAIANFSLGLVVKTNPNLYLQDAIETNNLKMYADNHLIIITDDKLPEIPTGNYTKIVNFNRIYMDTKDNLEKNNILSECLLSNGRCVLYVPTDTYWINGYNSNEIFSTLPNNVNIQYKKIANGSLGEFYLLNII